MAHSTMIYLPLINDIGSLEGWYSCQNSTEIHIIKNFHTNDNIMFRRGIIAVGIQ